MTEESPYSLAFEIAERNAEGQMNWRLRRALKIDCMDAWPPCWREYLTRWYAKRRELSARWLFKRRCEKRSAKQSFSKLLKRLPTE